MPPSNLNTYPNVKGVSFIKPYPTNSGSVVGRDHKVITRTWNGNTISSNSGMGSFRLAYNAGDPLSRVNYTQAGGPNQVTSTGRTRVVFSTNFDGVKSASASAIITPTATTNVKYVYDSSLFSRYKKELAINRGRAGLGTSTGDFSAGGGNNSDQVAINRVRH